MSDSESGSVEILKAVSKSSPICIYEFLQYPDHRSEFTYISDACEKIYRAKAEDIYNDVHLVFKNIHPDDVGWVAREIQEAARTLTPWERDYRLKYEDGTIAWVASYAIIQRRADGVAILHGTISDITERKFFENQMITASKLASIGELAAGVAHEINNPLMIAIGTVEHMLTLLSTKTIEPDVLRKKLTKLLEMTSRIAKITSSLKSVSRNDSSEEFVRLKLATCLNDSLELVKESYASKGVTLELGPIPEIEIDCRPTQISQVFINLLGNACDAAESTDEKWVKCQFRLTQPSKIQVLIQDSGLGIPAAIAAKIMSPFFTTKPRGVGTGLGLSIVQKILTGHGGTITLDSSQPHTTFVVEMPLKQALS